MRAIRKDQNPDGGWPAFWSGGASLDATCNALDRLESLQAEDGCWASEDGSAFDVETTSAAVRAFGEGGSTSSAQQ